MGFVPDLLANQLSYILQVHMNQLCKEKKEAYI